MRATYELPKKRGGRLLNIRLNARSKRVNRSFMGTFSLFALLAVFGAFMALPLVYAINNAFKPLDEIFLFPPTLFVRNPTWNNFSDLINLLGQSWVPFSRYIFNTVFITGVGIVGHVIFASAAAYPLAKHKFPGKVFLFQIVVLSLMFTPVVTATPNYMILSWLGLIDTYWAVIIPAFGYSLGLYLMKQFMEQIPDALLEAAKIDGASDYRIFWSIVMPNVKPAWLTLIILLFQILWGTDGNGFIYSEQLKTLHYASNQIILGGISRAGAGAAVAVILMSVPIVLFLFSQSRIIETMATSGMKD
ncbi:carbohydrate ABC transporter permease [Paenibacillus sp. NPDC093718]|uniref:carbohydrate ABC transporter permease n=1 Tax=Paenibacillus sp. NPDC093718 TaxID=3390601 RepID=UPI003CFD44F6